MKAIRLYKVRQNNLKEFDLEIPLGSLTVITGVSGAGKSSLAFDTLYAEGQRRYVETFSPYARQFMERMDRPRVERIEGIPPAIAIEQGDPVKTSRSTVGTMTEITDYVKLLFPRLAQLYCRRCGRPVRKENPERALEELSKLREGTPLVVTFPLPLGERVEERRRELLQRGFYRVWMGGLIAVEGAPAAEEWDVVVDRFLLRKGDRKRILDSLEMASREGRGRFDLQLPGGETLRFSEGLDCPYCGIRYREPTPNLFSFNSPVGACETCRGFGRVMDIDLDLVIPDQQKSLQEGAIRPWTGVAREEFEDLMAFCRRRGIPTDVPFKDLTEEQKRLIIEGDRTFYGVKGFFRWLESKRYKLHVRVFLSRYRSYVTCLACRGTRFKEEALLWRLKGKNIAEIYALNVEEAHRFFEELSQGKLDEASRVLVEEVKRRLEYLLQVGLGYLTLDRQSRTLSGGEVERVSLTKALGSSLVNTLYVLDEPTVGLHPRDSARLLEVLRSLRDQGNTVVVVEHDPEIIRGADHLVDLGPGAGERGGEVIYSGPPEGILEEGRSLTGRYLRGELRISVPRRRRPKGEIVLRGAAEHNLKGIDVRIPLGVMVAVTGVSGSGKSTLVVDVLYRGLRRMKGHYEERPGRFDRIEGVEGIADVVLVDQRPPGRTPRATPVTYLKAYDPIRKLFASQPLAIGRGYTPSTFSFNTRGGRCEECRGEGFEKVQMQFLSDVYLLCPRCKGSRFKEEVLEVTYRGKDISQVLSMTAEEAVAFFPQPEIRRGLEPLLKVGLGYLRLGQPMTTLSGGEAQRLKLAGHLSIKASGPLLFILDEPTIGLHPYDVKKLIEAFQGLIERGHTVLVVEHNPEVIKVADYVIDLGPEGGEEGGWIVAQGTPEEVAQAEGSHTGRFLRPYLEGRPQELRPGPRGGRGYAGGDGVILVRGAKEHNLKDLSLSIPRDRMVAITGVSGSGKSTLAFDILFAEGQRRYLECLPNYIRQYLKVMDRPEVDSIEGIPPTVAIEQRTSQGGRRSTVATLTEIYHYLRLLWSKLGVQHCPGCGSAIRPQSPALIMEEVLRRFGGKRATIVAPLVMGRKGFHRELLRRLKRSGISKALIDGQVRELEPLPELERFKEHDIEAVVGELQVEKGLNLKEALDRALRLSKGSVRVIGTGGERELYSTRLYCSRCHRGFEPLDPRLFSFNSRQGACPYCQGIGSFSDFLPELVIPDPRRSLQEGALAPFEHPALRRQRRKVLREIAERLGIPLDRPIVELGKGVLRKVLYGGDGFRGVIPTLRELSYWLEEDLGDLLLEYMGDRPCPRCGGKRLREEALAVKVKGWGIGELVALSVEEAEKVISSWSFSAEEWTIAEDIISELLSRLRFLKEVGLGYLSLDRRGDTLSGGEAQRIRLAAQLGSNLTGVCYILDEPTIGLHPRDNQLLLESLRRLKERGNTILVVEHDEETIRRADHIVDLGPGAGPQGGRVVAQGTLEDLRRTPQSITGAYLDGRARREITSKLRPAKGWLTVIGARRFNLKGIDVRIPLGAITCVTGVSGSGKSTLVREVLYRGLKGLLSRGEAPSDGFKEIRGWEALRRVAEVDHSPIGRTPRSTPATYVGLFDEIRRLFAQVPEARSRGWGPGRFSFNLQGGRCEDCGGQGRIKVEMEFLPDVYITCEACGGRRYNEETLSVTYRGKNIHEVLEMTFGEGLEFFGAIPKVRKTLELLVEIGLDYLTFGQPSPTLSGGEAQRIKLVRELASSSSRTLYILDEPTTGLHIADIEKLLKILHKLADRGDTVVVIEHNLKVIKEADYVIDLGPEGGEKGGYLLVEGTPLELLNQTSRSYTAQALKAYLTRP